MDADGDHRTRQHGAPTEGMVKWAFTRCVRCLRRWRHGWFASHGPKINSNAFGKLWGKTRPFHEPPRSADILVCGFCPDSYRGSSEDGNTGLESPVNPQAGKPALRSFGRFIVPMRGKKPWKLPMKPKNIQHQGITNDERMTKPECRIARCQAGVASTRMRKLAIEGRNQMVGVIFTSTIILRSRVPW
jgi:hypothetical protein